MKDDPHEQDYEQTNELIRMLTDIRFKLLGAVPAASVAVISLVLEKQNHTGALFVGILGLVVTFAIMLYELRNTQLYDGATHRAKGLEQMLRLPLFTEGKEFGGMFNERPGRTLRLFGVKVWHDQGLAIIYGAAMAGWIYLIAYSAFALLQWRTEFALLLGGIAFVVVHAQFRALSEKDKP